MASEIDVLIVGGGPTGLMLALELSLQNISYRIVDRAPIRSDKSRALIVHSRSQELLHRHNLAHAFVSRGKVNLGFRVVVNKKVVAEPSLQNLADDTQFPDILFISQAETETFLDKALATTYEKAVERPVNVRDIKQDATGVTVRLTVDGVEEAVRCKYVVGCDGAHSIVRHSAGLTFEGGAYDQDFILGDVHITASASIDQLTVYLAQGLIIAFPLNDEGLVRLVITRPGGADAHGDEPSLTDFQEVYDQMALGDGKLHDPVWMTRFRLNHRIVDDYRCGRLFVAGDAAHIHSPAGGQGMNTGMQDAVNLGWKIGLILRGESDDALLDTYSAERHPVGERLLKTTDRMFRVASTTSRVFVFLRNLIVPWVIPWVMNNIHRRRRAFGFMSQRGIRYRSSPIVAAASTWNGALRGGDRAPDGKVQSSVLGSTTLLSLCTGPSHHLFLFSGMGATAADFKSLQSAASRAVAGAKMSVEIHEVFSGETGEDYENVDQEGKLHERYGFAEPGYVFIRPDTHIAHIGALTAIDELGTFIRETYW